MIKTPITTLYYLTTNQSEESPQAAALPLSVAFKNPSLKAIREFRSFEHKLSVHSLCLVPIINAVLSFTRTQCQQIDYSEVWVSNSSSDQ